MRNGTTNAAAAADIQNWLVEKIAVRLAVSPASINVDGYLDEFGLDSTEALVLSGELEKWLGFEIETTALWYHPTIASLAAYIAEEREARGREYAAV
jgi:acyl carrier protein